MDKKKKIYLGIAIAAIVLCVSVGIGVFKTVTKMDIEGEGFNASTKDFYCKISNAYRTRKDTHISVYGECHSKYRMSSITTYFLNSSGGTLYTIPKFAYGFKNRTVNTTSSISTLLGKIEKEDYLRIKICAKDQKGYVVCSSEKSVRLVKVL